MAQVALALVLLIGAGLLMKSLSRLQSVEPGFDANNLLTMRVNLPQRKYDSDPKLLSFFKQAIEQIQAIPGSSQPARLTRFHSADRIQGPEFKLKASQSVRRVRTSRPVSV